MTLTALDIRPINLRTASQAEYAALGDFLNRMRAERLPDDPPMPLSERIADWQNMPPNIEVSSWAVWTGSSIIAYADVGFERREENQHLAWFYVGTHPEHRRQGLAKTLLERVVEIPERENRRLLICDSNDRAPAGEAMLRRIGAERGLETHTNQLLLSDLPDGLLQRWIAQAPNDEFEMLTWIGPVPDEHLEAYASLVEVMNTAPRGTLEIEDEKVTPEKIREWEKWEAATQHERRTVLVRERSTGRFAGFTQTGWHTNRPTILGQWGTGVRPDYRGKGLGKWIKAAMLEWAMRDRPSITKVRTGNADSNGPMLAINHAMGFKPFIADIAWQVSTETLRAYLNRR